MGEVVASLLGAVAAAVTVVWSSSGAAVYSALPFRHVAMAGLLIALMFGPLGCLASRVSGWTPGAWASAGGVSHALYVLHVSLVVDWNRVNGRFGFVTAAILLVMLSWAIERLLPRLLPAAPRS